MRFEVKENGGLSLKLSLDMTQMDLKTPGLYIHIPFCLKKCSYCNFYSITTLADIPDFLEALFKEMEMARSKFGPIDTVYLGGGTPSILGPKQLKDILENVRKNFILLPGAEITIETNPGDLDINYLKFLRDLGINRLQIGIQSFDQKTLDFLGRRHSVKQALSTIEASREAGFDNMGFDLIYGITGQEMKSWQNTLTQAMAFAPEHLSCYQLTLEGQTPLWIGNQKGEFDLPGENMQYEFFMKTSEWLEDSGYIHYEVSNFARGMAFASRHNQKYWNHTPYLGLGPAAHSFSGLQRWWNHRYLDQYINNIKRGKSPIGGMETLTVEQMQLETLYLGFRTRKGVSLRGFEEEFHYNLLTKKKEILDKLIKEGFLSIQNGYLVPTRAGFAVADHLALI